VQRAYISAYQLLLTRCGKKITTLLGPRFLGFSHHLDHLVEPGLEHNLKWNRAPSACSIVLVQIDRMTWHFCEDKRPQYLRYGEPNFALCNEYTGADAPTDAKSPVVTKARVF